MSQNMPKVSPSDITILHTESSKGWGGQEIRILQESIGIRDRGYRVLIAAERDSIIYKKAEEKGFQVFDVKFLKFSPASFIRLKQIIEDHKVKIINTHSSKDSWIGSIAAKTASNRPKIIRTRHLSTPISNSLSSRFIYDIMPDLIITTGEAIRLRMIEQNRFNPKKIFSIPTGVILEKFNRERVNASLEKKEFNIGAVGVLRSWKGHEFLLKAFPIIVREIRGLHCYIVGDGPQYNRLLNLAKELEIEKFVTFTGHREDIPEVLASLDLLIHPSYANEGVPQTILQALAMEVPVIASKAGAIPEVIVHGKTGILIEPRNEIEIARTVIELYHDKRLRENLAKAGRELVEREYSHEKMIEKIDKLYRQLLM